MKHSASLLIENPDGAFLLIQRGDGCKNFKGCWEFPGGKTDPGESVHAGLVREVREEAGIVAAVPEDQGGCHIQTANGEVDYAFFAWQCPAPLPEIRLSKEHRAFKWARFTEARKLDLMAPHREFLERFWHQQQLAAYKQELPHYRIYEQTLKEVLDHLRERWAPLAIVQARAKSLSSFAEKCLRKADQYDAPARQLTDLCGGRIIATTTHEMEALCRQIRQIFVIDEDDDTRQRHEISAFGYLSVHFIVHLPEGCRELLGVPVSAEIGVRKAEIQVRTLLQHAHSEVTHDRLYKSGFKPPQHCRREAARMAAQLEQADEEFATFVAKLDAYVGHYAAHLPPEKRQRQIADLKLVLDHEADARKKPALALRIARLARAAWDWAGVVEAVSPFADIGGTEQPSLQMEFGNALCRLHRGAPQSADFRHGLRLLEGVAQPAGDFDKFMECDDRGRRATALALLGSALAKQEGHRAEARACLAGAVRLAPNDPYHFAAFVELDVVATGTDEHVDLLAPSLAQAVGRCEEHVRAGIEVTRAWLTLAKIRLLSGDDSGALESLCLAARCAETEHPLSDFQHSLDRLKDALGVARPGVGLLDQCAWLLARAKALRSAAPCGEQDWPQPVGKRFEFQAGKRVTILAGSTDAVDAARWPAYEKHLRAALEGYEGYVLTGGTTAGICGVTARVVGELNAAGRAKIEPVGYLPEHLPPGATVDASFPNLVCTGGTRDFSVREPLQMWADLLAGGGKVNDVSLLCLGGGVLSAAELTLAWALGARSCALADGSRAAGRFANVLDCAGDLAGRGSLVPDDSASLAALLAFDLPIDAATWEEAGHAVHTAYVASQHKKATQPNLLPWTHLREDFKHSNRHQAACSAEILRRTGFVVERSSLPADKIPLPELKPEEVEVMAEAEHGRWIIERLNAGWRFGKKKDEAHLLSPWLTPWRLLPDEIKGYDRDAVRTWPKILAAAGWVVSPP